MESKGRADYRTVLANREFLALLVSQSLSVVGDQVARIALALLVYSRTGSALAASATYAVSYGAYLLGGPLLSTLADRYPRRTVMVVSDLLRMVLVLAMVAQPATPVLFALIALAGAVSPAFTSAQSANLPDILGDTDYSTGLGLMSSLAQVSQFVGFALGGGLVAATSVGAALGTDAATFALSAATILLLVRHRPATAGGRSNMLVLARQGAQVVWTTPALRQWLTWGLLISVGSAVPEGLAVAVSRQGGGGALEAGLLTAALPLGFVLGTVLVLRVPVHQRQPLVPQLTALTFGPLILTPVAPNLLVAITLWVVGGAGGAAQIIANSEYALRCTPDLRGRAFGLAGTALMVWQAVVLLLAGATAGIWAANTVVSAAGVLGLLATAGLIRQQRMTDRLKLRDAPVEGTRVKGDVR